MSKERLLSALSKSGLVESKSNFDDGRLKEVRKDFNDARLKEIRKKFNELRDRFSMSQMKGIRKNLHDIKNQKNLSTQKIKEIEKVFLNQKNAFLILRSIAIKMTLTQKYKRHKKFIQRSCIQQSCTQ